MRRLPGEENHRHARNGHDGRNRPCPRNHVKGKTIVLVGAMIPYAFGVSDALFNLGCEFAAVQALPQCVYITMNGKIFAWDNVRKNKESGDFEKLKDERQP